MPQTVCPLPETQGDGDEMRRWSEELARNPSSPVFLPLAETLRRRGQLEPARQVAARGVARHPRDPHARDLLARILVDRGDLLAASDEWATALQLAPGHIGAIKGMAFIRFQQGKLEESERLLLQAAASGSDANITAAIDTVRASGGNTFQSFLSDVTSAVAEHLSELEKPVIAILQPLRVADNFFMDIEKVVWHWPDLGMRLTEDIR